MNDSPVGVLLAAGQSRRFGSNKLIHPVDGETPMLMICAHKLVNVLPDSVAVISSELMSYTGELEALGLRVIVNRQAQQGMGSSIACAVRARPAAAGWLITLADMPYLKPETIAQLAQRLANGAGMVAPVYQQQRGHPAGFHARYKDELLALNADIGARDIIAKYHSRLELVMTDDAGVIMDIDHPADLPAE